MRRRLADRVRLTMRKANVRRGGAPKMNEALRPVLEETFDADVRAVERILGKDLSKLWF